MYKVLNFSKQELATILGVAASFIVSKLFFGESDDYIEVIENDISEPSTDPEENVDDCAPAKPTTK